MIFRDEKCYYNILYNFISIVYFRIHFCCTKGFWHNGILELPDVMDNSICNICYSCINLFFGFKGCK